jgi:hypothetical protein
VPEGIPGSAIIESDQPLVALVHEVSLGGAWDSAAYVGVPADAHLATQVSYTPWLTKTWDY